MDMLIFNGVVISLILEQKNYKLLEMTLILEQKIVKNHILLEITIISKTKECINL